ncbi:MAG: hypothetical protein AABY22_20645, partial [Nanoarchaeota archaeon]
MEEIIKLNYECQRILTQVWSNGAPLFHETSKNKLCIHEDCMSIINNECFFRKEAKCYLCQVNEIEI